MSELNKKHLRIAGIKQLLLTSAFWLIHLGVFYIFAGSIPDVRSGFFFFVVFLNYSVSTLVQYRLNPGLLVQRLKIKREGSKQWDEILMRVSNLTAIIVIPAIAGFDVGRFQFFNLSIHFIALGLISIALSTIILNWAMVTNPHFEPTMRIQKDRDHKVITDGPYRFVRHPGYLAGIFYVLSVPLMIGSALTFIPVGIYIFLIMVRTWLEDQTLQRELQGYLEYSRVVRHRLFPGVW
jgi:protein-S-isoprenylcysteine O-methyltransferase Ste14